MIKFKKICSNGPTAHEHTRPSLIMRNNSHWPMKIIIGVWAKAFHWLNSKWQMRKWNTWSNFDIEMRTNRFNLCNHPHVPYIVLLIMINNNINTPNCAYLPSLRFILLIESVFGVKPSMSTLNWLQQPTHVVVLILLQIVFMFLALPIENNKYEYWIRA